MRKLAIVAIVANIVGNSLSVAYAQLEFDNNGSVFTTSTLPGRTIADPESFTYVCGFLMNRSVLRELNLDRTQEKELRNFLNRVGPAPLYLSYRETEVSRKLGAENIQLLVAAEKARRIQEIHSILDPLQLDRLKQIVYQIEVSRGGLGNALRFGYLGVAVQVETAQKGAIEITSDSVEKRAQTLIEKVKSKEHEELLSELSEHQKELYRRLIGKPFAFEENMRLVSPGRMAIPDPNSLEIVFLVRNKSIERELAILPDKSVELADFLKQVKGGTFSMIGLRYGKRANAEIVEGIKSNIEEILNSSQRARLKQLAFHVEMERIGLGDALVKGFLGKDLKLDEEQKRKVGSKSKLVDERIGDAVVKIKAAVKHDILRELTSIQREDAIRILGKDFAYREEVVNE